MENVDKMLWRTRRVELNKLLVFIWMYFSHSIGWLFRQQMHIPEVNTILLSWKFAVWIYFLLYFSSSFSAATVAEWWCYVCLFLLLLLFIIIYSFQIACDSFPFAPFRLYYITYRIIRWTHTAAVLTAMLFCRLHNWWCALWIALIYTGKQFEIVFEVNINEIYKIPHRFVHFPLRRFFSLRFIFRTMHSIY